MKARWRLQPIQDDYNEMVLVSEDYKGKWYAMVALPLGALYRPGSSSLHDKLVDGAEVIVDVTMEIESVGEGYTSQEDFDKYGPDTIEEGLL